MRISLGRRGDYSVRAALHVARHAHQGRQKAREISTEMDIPPRYSPQILANLVREGILSAVAGPDGGYALAREAADITLLQVVEAAEGAISLDRCALEGGPCDWERSCPMHATWSRAQRAFTDQLGATTLADLAQIDKAIEGGTYELPADTPDHVERQVRRGVRTAYGDNRNDDPGDTTAPPGELATDN